MLDPSPELRHTGVVKFSRSVKGAEAAAAASTNDGQTSERLAIIDWCSRIASSKSTRESLDGPGTVLEGSNRVILLDRDGVLNVDRVNSVRTVADLEVETGAIVGCRLLKDAGYPLGVICNQSAGGRGWMTATDVDAVNAELDRRLGGVIDAWFLCPHAPDDGCRCRKPGTLLLEQAQAEFGFDPRLTWFVVDAERDIAAARAFGCLPALVRTGKGAAAAAAHPDVPVFADLADFARSVVAER